MGAFSACLFYGLLVAVGQADKTKPKIVGGNKTYRRSYMVSLRDGRRHGCGGTLIAPNVVLTAAHCLEGILHPTVHVGRFYRIQEDDFELLQTNEAILHPQYNSTRLDNDIALLVLESQSTKEPVELQCSDSCFKKSGKCEVKILGWGKTDNGHLSEVLQEASTTSVSRSKCKAQLGAYKITSSMICTGGVQGGIDACHGDSGGPLLQSDKQVGIVSWGIGCAEAGKPGVYTSIPKLMGWIQQELDRISGLTLNQGDPACGSSSDDCDCTDDGVSGGVSTGRHGCKQHLSNDSDDDLICYVKGGSSCSTSNPSDKFPGAAWKVCRDVDQQDVCDCAGDGVSGGVSTGRLGCKQHLLDKGDYDLFCYVNGASSCSNSTPSQKFPGAAWKLCG